MTLQRKLREFIKAAQELETELGVHRESPNEAACRVLVCAELVVADGYQPRQASLQRLRAAVAKYHETITPQKRGGLCQHCIVSAHTIMQWDIEYIPGCVCACHQVTTD